MGMDEMVIHSCLASGHGLDRSRRGFMSGWLGGGDSHPFAFRLSLLTYSRLIP